MISYMDTMLYTIATFPKTPRTESAPSICYRDGYIPAGKASQGR